MKKRTWYLQSELVKATGLPRETIRNEMRAGHLKPAARVNNPRFKQVWRFDVTEVERWLKRRLERQAIRWSR